MKKAFKSTCGSTINNGESHGQSVQQMARNACFQRRRRRRAVTRIIRVSSIVHNLRCPSSLSAVQVYSDPLILGHVRAEQMAVNRTSTGSSNEAYANADGILYTCIPVHTYVYHKNKSANNQSSRRTNNITKQQQKWQVRNATRFKQLHMHNRERWVNSEQWTHFGEVGFAAERSAECSRSRHRVRRQQLPVSTNIQREW